MREKQRTESIALYVRDDTGQPRDVERQLELCRQYAELYFGKAAWDVVIYREQSAPRGRPQLDALLADADAGKLRAVICARLDRICQSAGELATLLEKFSGLSVIFAAVEEQLTTAAPLGRAMGYLTAVLQRLERQGASERMRDNMLELARTGRWLGGVTPTGYSSQRIARKGETTEYALEPLESEARTVRIIFKTFLEENSLTKVEQHLENTGIRTKNNRAFSRFTIRQLLENPVYMQADRDALHYFQSLGVQLCSPDDAFDGTHGMMVYNKTVQQEGKAGKAREKTSWIVAVGKHHGLIAGANWVRAQQLLDQNKSAAFRKPKSAHALLPGLLRCRSCGAYMRPKQTQRLTEDGQPVFIYLCENKERSKSQECQMKNVSGNLLDQVVCDELGRLSADSAALTEQLERSCQAALPRSGALAEEPAALQRRRGEIEKSISDLVFALVKTIDKVAYDYIIQQIDALHKENASIQERMDELIKLGSQNPLAAEQMDMARGVLRAFQTGAPTMTIEEKRAALRTLVEKVVWDGTQVQVFLFGTTTGDLDI